MVPWKRGVLVGVGTDAFPLLEWTRGGGFVSYGLGAMGCWCDMMSLDWMSTGCASGANS